MGVRRLGLILAYVVSFGAIALWLYLPPVGWESNIKWGDVGGWLGGIGSMAAAGVALWLAGESHRREDKRDRHTARAIATTICSEMVGNCFDLEGGLDAIDSQKYPLSSLNSKFLNLHTRLQHRRTSTYEIHIDHIRCFDVKIASAINVAYGGLLVCNDIEKGAELTRKGFADIPNVDQELEWTCRYMVEREDACKGILEKLQEAIRLIWPLTEYSAFFPDPVISKSQEKEFDEAKRKSRTS